MNKESLYLIKVLKSFIHTENPGYYDGDWVSLIRFAKTHSVNGILGYMARTYPEILSNQDLMKVLRRQCMRSLMFYSKRNEQMKMLMDKMNERGIDHLLFKGLSLRIIIRYRSFALQVTLIF